MAVTQIGEWSVIDNDLQIVPEEYSGTSSYRASVCNLGGGRAIFGCNVRKTSADDPLVFIRALYFDQSGEVTLGKWRTHLPSFKGPISFINAAPLVRIDNYHAFFYRVIAHDWDGVNQTHDGATRRTHVRFTVRLDSDGNISLYDDIVVPPRYEATKEFAADSTGTGEVWGAVWAQAKNATPYAYYIRSSLDGGSGYGFTDADKEYYYALGAANLANNSFDYFVVQNQAIVPNNEHWRVLRPHTPGENPGNYGFQWAGHARPDTLDPSFLVKDGVRYFVRVVTDDSVNFENPRVEVSHGLGGGTGSQSLSDTSTFFLDPATLNGNKAYGQGARHLPGGGFFFKFMSDRGMNFVEIDEQGLGQVHVIAPFSSVDDATTLSEIDNMGGLLTWANEYRRYRVAVITQGGGPRIPELRMRARDDVGSRIMASTSQQASTRVRTGGNTYV